MTDTDPTARGDDPGERWQALAALEDWLEMPMLLLSFAWLALVVGTANRGMNALRASLKRRGLGYVLAATALVIGLGAGGMLAFETAREVEGGFESYGDALWWTGMLMTSLGSEFWPRTAEGRVLCFLLALYGFAVFGYITASFASFFVGRDAAAPDSETPGLADIAALHQEIAALRRELRG